MTPDTLAALLRARATGTPVVLATRLADGTQVLLPDGAAPDALAAAGELAAAAAAALHDDQSRLAQIDAETWFLQVQAPAHRLLIVGAVHIAQALAPMAALAGLDVAIIDPRRGFASAERFPGVALVHDWPDEAMAARRPDRRTAVVTLTHDPRLDDPALDFALRGAAFFIGALGSKKTHAARLERLAALGHGPAALARIRGPVGLPIGAVTAAEIALSVLAEVVAARRGAALGAR
jgi:xanthine dehydrogenase accessory factor